MTQAFHFVLVLGGGNALGGYHAGVYQALHESGLEPDWVVGASAGAITGSLIAGNAPEDRLDRLARFWRPAAGETPWWAVAGDTLRRTAAVAGTMAGGRPGMFGAVGPLGSWWDPDPAAAAPALFDLKPLVQSLATLADWDRLNAGSPRYTATAVDLETGEDVAFDTARDRLTPDHVRASGSLLPTFAPVEIDGRALTDGGLSANLPLDPVLGDPPAGQTLCLAVDLLPLAQARPRTLGEAIARTQNLVFAIQTRRSIERWQAAYRAEARLADASVTVATIAYRDQAREVAGKAMDFSPETMRERWDAGLRDGRAFLARLEAGDVPTGAPGLTVVS